MVHIESKSPSPSDRIGVVGGGLGGLAAACTLAARGHHVTLFEARQTLGGKAAVLQRDGFRFDMGPTILTLPSVLARIFSEAGRRLEDAIDLVCLDPQWRCFFPGGDVLDLHADTQRMTAAIRDFSSSPLDASGYQSFMGMSQRLQDVSERYFFWRSVESVADTFRVRGSLRPKLLRDLLALRTGRTVHGTVRSFVKDERVAQMLDHFTQYVGSAPDQSPAVLCGIASMQTSEGVWYPSGGTGALPLALATLAEELGVDIRTGTAVRRILSERGAVTGVETEAGESVPLRAVVSNSDAVRTHEELLGGDVGARFRRKRRFEPACSGVVLYLGLREAYDHLLHHNFVFSNNSEREFDQIYSKGEPAEDPTCYVCAPARSDPSVAPERGEALYVLVHTPYLRPWNDWKVLLPAYRETILGKLQRVAGLEDIKERIVVEDHLTPQDIHERYRVLRGAIYGLSSHGRFRGAFKPGNRSRLLRGLYLAGGAAHPGPGMPMVLMSGWIAADCLDRDHSPSPVEASCRATP